MILHSAPLLDTNVERWDEHILEFPRYAVSDFGRVLNKQTGFYIKATKNTRGLAMVGLMRNGVQHKKSVAVLVASSFVPRADSRRHEKFDNVINLDGDRMNNHYTNLAWRPLWFARKYSLQFSDNHSSITTPIEDVETGEIYENSMHASTVNGVLDIDIYLSMINNTYVFPTGQVFRKVLSR